MLLYADFFRRFGVRRVGHLQNPVYAKLDKLQLPRESVYVYLPTSDIEEGPSLDDLYLKNIHRPIMMNTITELTATRGNPRRMSVMLNDIIRKYHIRNRKYRPSRSFEQAVRDPTIPYVINCAMMQRRYKYFRNIYTEYNKWYNGFHTVITNIAKLATQSERNIFMEVPLPRTLPGINVLRMAEIAGNTTPGLKDIEDNSMALGQEDFGLSEAQINEHLNRADVRFAMEAGADFWDCIRTGDYSLSVENGYVSVDWENGGRNIGLETMSTAILKKMDGPQAFMLAEIWRWLGKSRVDSVLTLLTGHYKKINLVFRVGMYWTVVNLGVLDSWRKTPDGENIAIPLWLEGEDAPIPDPDPKYVEVQTKGLPTKDLQLRFMRFLMNVFELGTVATHAAELAQDATDLVEDLHDREDTGLMAEPEAKAEIVSDPRDRLIESSQDAEDQALDESAIEEELRRLTEITSTIADAKATEQITRAAVVATPEQGVINVIKKHAADGSISAAEYVRFEKLSSAYKKITVQDHLGNDVALEEFVKIPKELTQIKEVPMIKDIDTVPDKSMLKSSLLTFDESYIKNVMQRDVAGMVLNMQKAGLCVTDYTVDQTDDISGSYHDYTVRFAPVIGTPSTLRFRIPAVKDDGTYYAGGIKYRIRKQRGDLPIRKTAPNKVALTSYYGKFNVTRSEKRSANYTTWINNALMAAALDQSNTVVTEAHPTNVFDNKFKCPRLYSTLAMSFRSIQINGWTWMLDHTAREKLYGADFLKEYEKDGSIIVAMNNQGDKMLMDSLGGLYAISADGMSELSSLEEQAGLILSKRPTEYAELKVSGKEVPLGVVLSYYYGYDNLCHRLNIRPRIVAAGQRLQLGLDEFPVVFSDETHIYSRDDQLAAMIMGGLHEMSDTTKQYASHEFNKPAVYLNVVEGIRGAGVRQIREMDMLDKLFVDPITLELLTDMKEPTDWRGLLIRATEMLLLDYHPDQLDPLYMRIKGYERLAGIVYKELVTAVKAHNSRSDRARQSIELNPHTIWRTISSDASISLVEEINPIQNLKEVEAVTYSGVGGRSGRSMTKSTRVYHENEPGVISESTVDSGDVAINVYTSANPTFTSIRGVGQKQDLKTIEPSSLLSTSALVSPSSDRDDPKRVNFIAIQQRHVVPCSGYTQAAVRTGYEQVIGHRTGDLFCTTARQDGKVISISDDGIIVEYADGEKKGIELGRRFGMASGMTIPHSVKTNLTVGEKFKVGAVLAYNDGFFEADLFDPEQVVMKAGVLTNVVLMEAPITLEDSSAISKETAALLQTKITKVKQVVVRFNQHIHRLVKPGTELNEDDILCIIEDAITADNKLFDEESLELLKILGAQAPMAKAHGTLERLEVFYHGDKEDMSASLKQVADYSDRQLAKRRGAAGMKRYTGSVDEGFRVDGNPLMLDTACLKFYITSDVHAGVGDKGVFANQMKTVFGEVLPMEVKTESGTKIGAIFGQKSIDDRIVNSPELIGTTTVCLELIGKKAADIYFG